MFESTTTKKFIHDNIMKHTRMPAILTNKHVNHTDHLLVQTKHTPARTNPPLGSAYRSFGPTWRSPDFFLAKNRIDGIAAGCRETGAGCAAGGCSACIRRPHTQRELSHWSMQRARGKILFEVPAPGASRQLHTPGAITIDLVSDHLCASPLPAQRTGRGVYHARTN